MEIPLECLFRLKSKDIIFKHARAHLRPDVVGYIDYHILDVGRKQIHVACGKSYFQCPHCELNLPVNRRYIKVELDTRRFFYIVTPNDNNLTIIGMYSDKYKHPYETKAFKPLNILPVHYVKNYNTVLEEGLKILKREGLYEYKS